MSVANFFQKNVLAASQVLHGFEEAAFTQLLESFLLCIIFDETIEENAEAKVTLELAINLIARLYPKIIFKPHGPKAVKYSEELVKLARSINPSIYIGSDSDSPSFCISIGFTTPEVECPVVYAGSDGWIAKISSKAVVGSGNSANPFGASAAACFAAANAFRFAFSKQLTNAELDSEFQVSLIDWNLNSSTLQNPIIAEVDLGETYLVGVGAIGNAAIWNLSKMPQLQGTLHLIDEELVDLSNLQRYVLTDQTSINVEKVLLGKKALSSSHMNVVPHHQSWDKFLAANNNWKLERVLVAVDTTALRRNVQASLPRSIINSWTQAGDIGVSRHLFLGDQACLMCLYFPAGSLKNEDMLVAEAIGLPGNIMEIRAMLYAGTPLSKEFLARIAIAKQVEITNLLRFEGGPLRSLYVEGICGGALLELVGGSKHQLTEVPMNFQSVLAGVMLSAELIISAAKLRGSDFPVTTKIDLLKSLGNFLSLPAPKHASRKCICQDEDYIHAYRSKYN